MATALDVITNGLHLINVIDQTESPSSNDVAASVPILNNLLRHEMADGACQFTITRVAVTLPQGASGQPYTFSIGTAQSTYLVQADAVAVRQIWMNDINITVNRETREAPSADVVRTLYPGIITKWHQERQVDGSVLVTAWQPPRASAPALIEYGGRIAALTKTDGSDPVNLPPEGLHDAAMLFARRVAKGYGIVFQPTDPLVADMERVNNAWRTWARGQQWLRFARS